MVHKFVRQLIIKRTLLEIVQYKILYRFLFEYKAQYILQMSES